MRQLCLLVLKRSLAGDVLTSEGLTPAAGSLIGCVAFMLNSVQRSREVKRPCTTHHSHMIFRTKVEGRDAESRDTQPCLRLALSLMLFLISETHLVVTAHERR